MFTTAADFLSTLVSRCGCALAVWPKQRQQLGIIRQRLWGSTAGQWLTDAVQVRHFPRCWRKYGISDQLVPEDKAGKARHSGQQQQDAEAATLGERDAHQRQTLQTGCIAQTKYIESTFCELVHPGATQVEVHQLCKRQESFFERRGGVNAAARKLQALQRGEMGKELGPSDVQLCELEADEALIEAGHAREFGDGTIANGRLADGEAANARKTLHDRVARAIRQAVR
mmetsp:Transcript_22397/g.72079  ORF Transcript_22397/g.72079 Transcript_22397/m.72079 type:complete len:228 (+) Transcript_22397:382-1065(+)